MLYQHTGILLLIRASQIRRTKAVRESKVCCAIRCSPCILSLHKSFVQVYHSLGQLLTAVLISTRYSSNLHLPGIISIATTYVRIYPDTKHQIVCTRYVRLPGRPWSFLSPVVCVLRPFYPSTSSTTSVRALFFNPNNRRDTRTSSVATKLRHRDTSTMLPRNR